MSIFFQELIARKKSDYAFFLGCGQSINQLSDDNIDNLHKNFDVWTTNNFLIHQKIVPHFYHLEVKAHRNGPLIRRASSQKKDLYRGTTWIIDKTRPYIFDYLSKNDYLENKFLFYDKIYRQEQHGKYHPDKERVCVSINASITLVLDMMVRMNYKTIYFLGVDMNTSEYFWTDNNLYKDVLIESIIQTTKPDERHPKSLHPTSQVANFLPEFMSFNGQDVANLSNISLLKDKIRTLDIEDVL